MIFRVVKPTRYDHIEMSSCLVLRGSFVPFFLGTHVFLLFPYHP